MEQGRFEDAEPLLRQALTIHETRLGPEHQHVATSLNSYALLLDSMVRPSTICCGTQTVDTHQACCFMFVFASSRLSGDVLFLVKDISHQVKKMYGCEKDRNISADDG